MVVSSSFSVSCGTRTDDRRTTSPSFDDMATISGREMRLADGAFGGVVEQVTVPVQSSFRLQAPRVMEGVDDVGDQAFAGFLATR